MANPGGGAGGGTGNVNGGFGAQFQNFLNNGGYGMIGQGLDMIRGFMPQNSAYQGEKGHQAQMYDGLSSAASDMAMQINPAYGLAMKAGGFVNQGLQALTGGTDGMTSTDAFLSSDTLATTGAAAGMAIGGPIGAGVGMLLGAGVGAVNSAFGSTTRELHKDMRTFQQMGSSYGGTSSAVDEAKKKAGKKYGAFSKSAKREAENEIWKADSQQIELARVAADATEKQQLQSSMHNMAMQNYTNQFMGIYSPKNLRAARRGCKLVSDKELQRIRNITKRVYKAEAWSYEEEIPEFKEGGKINIIPDGALHANLNHMEQKGITKKGIPVITEEEDGSIIQHAEIERNEIIFNLDVVEKLEKLMEDNSEEAAIEAGKLLTKEILYNTQDFTGLIKEVD